MSTEKKKFKLDSFHWTLIIILGMMATVDVINELTPDMTTEEIKQHGIDIGITRTTSPCDFKQMVEDGRYNWELSENIKELLDVVDDC